MYETNLPVWHDSGLAAVLGPEAIMDRDEVLAMLSAKLVFLEHAVRTLCKQRYLEYDDPVAQAKRAATELKDFFNPRKGETQGVLYLQQAVDSFYDVLVSDLERDLDRRGKRPQAE
jgi:hypothetical protein